MKPRHLSYANVASSLALVVALGAGGAYAATLAKNSVGSAQLKHGAVRAADLGRNSVSGKSVQKDALTGRDIDESSLGTVPSAASVATARRANATAGVGGASILLTRGPFTFALQCGGGPGTAEARLLLASSGAHGRWISTTGFDLDFGAAEGPTQIARVATAPGREVNVSVAAADGHEFAVVGVILATGSSCFANVAVLG